MARLITGKPAFMGDWIRHKQIKLRVDANPAVRVAMHLYLADVLLNNVLSNAIRHNHPGGQLTVLLSSQQLTVANTGEPPTQPTEQLRQRFRKDNPASDSPGLGLSIIDEIGRTYGMSMHYHYAVGWHYLTLDWPPFDNYTA